MDNYKTLLRKCVISTMLGYMMNESAIGVYAFTDGL